MRKIGARAAPISAELNDLNFSKSTKKGNLIFKREEVMGEGEIYHLVMKHIYLLNQLFSLGMLVHLS